MPALLSDGNQHYIRSRKIQANDPVGQLSYYLTTSSASSQSSAQVRRGRPSGSGEESQASAFYATHLTRAIASRQQQLSHRQASHQVVTRTGQQHSKNNLHLLESPPNSSGFSDGTREELQKTEFFGPSSFQVQLGDAAFIRKQTNHHQQGLWRPQPQRQVKSQKQLEIDGDQSATAALQPARRKQVAVSSRQKRRNIKRFNRRMLPSDDRMDHLSTNPYALSELFSQSEIPGFREIFASDSYLRKLCWIVAFLLMTVASLNDMTELITEFYEYPVTVDVRLRDSARLPFPSVTVCNLNVVRYSALCSTSNERFNLTDKIPSELREKLCGLQVEKKNTTGESDIGDINNIGLSSTTTTSTSTTTAPSNVTQGVPEDGSPTEQSKLSSSSPPFEHKAGAGTNNGSSAVTSGTSTTHAPSSTSTSDEFAESSGLLMSDAERRRLRRSIRLDWPERHGGGSARPFASRSSQVRVWTGPGQQVTPGQVMAAGHQTGGASQVDLKRLPAVNALNNVRVNLPSNLDRPGHGLPVNPAMNPKHAFLSPPTSAPPSATSTTPASFIPTALPEDFELTERQERELQESLTNWLAVMYNHDPKLTGLLGHQFDDMLLRCTMKSTNCTHRRSFDTSFTPTEGNCFTYRSKFRRRSPAGVANGAKLGVSGAAGGQLYEEANLASTSHGLELVLNLEKNEYISGSSQVGALVMVHHPSDQGYAASEATFVAPEFTTYIGVKMVNLTRLPSPYPEHCVDNWPTRFADKLTRNSTYSQQACIRICLQRTIQSHCSCQYAFLPIVDWQETQSATTTTATGAQVQQLLSQQQQPVAGSSFNGSQPAGEAQRVIICDTRKVAIRQCVHEVMLRPADRVHNCECPPKCQVVRYDKTISMAKWPTREDKVTFDRGKMDLNFQNLAKVIVYFQTMTCDEVTQQALFNPAKLFSALGGIMGMYVGFSFLSVFEIFEVMSRKMWHHFKVRLFGSSTSVFRDNIS